MPTSWTPVPGVQWQWQLSGNPTQAELNTAYAAGARSFDIDGGNATAAVVAQIHALGPNVGAVCYIDAGGWEDYRPDAAQFPASVKGNIVDGWPHEKWLDIRQLDILRPLMDARIQDCKAKGFDGLEPDMIEGYSNNSGFPLTAAHQIAYNRMIADLGHAAGLKVAQKGDTEQSAQLQPYFDWVLNEECGAYSECNSLLTYKNAGKAVWIVEYGTSRCASDFPIAGQAAMRKSLNLTASPRVVCMSA